jgi:alpha-D-xyloside xylohydrolase
VIGRPILGTLPRVHRPILLAALLSLPILAAACIAQDGQTPAVITSGVAEASVDDSYIFFNRDAVLLGVAPPKIELGFVDEVKESINYDPYAIVADSPLLRPPGSLEWRSPQKISRAGAVVTLDYGDGVTVVVNVSGEADGAFLVDMQVKGGASRVAYVRFAATVPSTEPIYGLGEHLDTVNQRGVLRAMQLELDSKTEGPDNDARVPVPLLVAPSGYGLFVDSSRPMAIDVGKSTPDWISTIVDVAFAREQRVPLRVYLGATPSDVLARFNARVGKPALPPPWATGPWFWRDENTDQAQVESDLDAIRANDLPASGYWIDRPYATDVNTFDFAKPQFPNPERISPKANALGMRTALWHVPYLDEKSAATKALFDEATQRSFYAPVSGVLLNRWGKPLDLTNEAARTFWKGKLQAYRDLGFEGYKLDYAEDVAPGLGLSRNAWRFADGSDERTMHAGYTDLYHRTYRETLPAEGGFLLVRRGYAGDQAKGVIVWPGDLDATFSTHGERTTKAGETYLSVGGLPAAFKAGLSLATSGFPFFAADTGGYRHSPPDGELLTRWAQASSLFFAMQIGNSASTVPWEPDAANEITGETLAAVRASTVLFTRLHPFRWSLLAQYKDGGPLPLAPLGLVDPALAAEEEEVLLGGVLLGAPVLHRGVRERDVLFPKGRWLDLATNVFCESKARIAAPLGTLPLFQREGSIVPMARPSVKTLAPATDPRVDSFANDPGRLFVRVVPGAAASFTLYDGGSLRWDDGATSTFVATTGSTAWKGLDVEIVGDARAVASVTADGAALTRASDEAALDGAEEGYVAQGSRVRIKVKKADSRVVIAR